MRPGELVALSFPYWLEETRPRRLLAVFPRTAVSVNTCLSQTGWLPWPLCRGSLHAPAVPASIACMATGKSALFIMRYQHNIWLLTPAAGALYSKRISTFRKSGFLMGYIAYDAYQLEITKKRFNRCFMVL